MAISSTSLANLDSYYQQLINYQISNEQKPMDVVTKQVDTLKIQKALYSDLSTKFNSLQSSIKALLSTDPFYSMVPGRATSISSSATQSVITASAGSAAIVGDYTINITTLARGEKARSDQQAYSDQGLNLNGTFVIGGAESRSVANGSTNSTVSGFSTSGTIISGQSELGTSDYFVETRETDTGEWEFRVVDGNGKAMNIRNASEDDDSLTTNWQAIPTGGGSYDTGRGLSFTFGADLGLYTANYRTNGAAAIEYTAQGASITVSESDSLEDIAESINTADYADGNEISATIVDKQLIIQTKNTGSTKTISAVDAGTDTILQDLGILTGLGAYKNFTAETDASQDAVFTVNGLEVTRSSNTAITDVITGVSLNLSPNSETLSATLSVTADSTNQKAAVDSFILKFNDLSKYVRSKIATVKNEDETYTRGGLAGDMTFRLFSGDMFTTLNGKYENDGEFSYLFELGLEFNDNNELTITDSTKLTDALKNKFNDVELFFEKIMGAMDAKVSIFAGTSGYISTAISLNENQTTFYNDRITSMKNRLDLRRTQLTNQYLIMQSQIEQMTNQQQTLQAGFTNYTY
jgi:flagellar hook-associated protein 2